MLIENIAKIFYLVHTMNKENAIIAKKIHVRLKLNLTKNVFSHEIKMLIDGFALRKTKIESIYLIKLCKFWLSFVEK